MSQIASLVAGNRHLGLEKNSRVKWIIESNCALWHDYVIFIHLIVNIFSICSILTSFTRVSMGLTDRRKTAKKLVDSRKNWKILTVSRK